MIFIRCVEETESEDQESWRQGAITLLHKSLRIVYMTDEPPVESSYFQHTATWPVSSGSLGICLGKSNYCCQTSA